MREEGQKFKRGFGLLRFIKELKSVLAGVGSIIRLEVDLSVSMESWLNKI